MGRPLQRCRGAHLPFLSDSKTKDTLSQPGLQKNLGRQVIFCYGHQFRRKAGQLEIFTWKISARLKHLGRFGNVRMDTVSKMTGSGNYKQVTSE